MNYKSYSLHNFTELPQLSRLSSEQVEAIRVVGSVLPFKSNNYVTEQMIDWNNIPDDPIFTLTFPRREMLAKPHYEKVAGLLRSGADPKLIKDEVNKIRLKLNPNPAGQVHNIPLFEGTKLHGIQHKYRETVLFFPSQGRPATPIAPSVPLASIFGNERAEVRMKSCPAAQISAEALQGYRSPAYRRDPLTANAKILSAYTNRSFRKSHHIQNIRIGSKSLAYCHTALTDKIADDLLLLFEKVIKAGKHLAFQAHFNHPDELMTDAVKKAIGRIRNTGVQIRTQSPLLRNINDNPETWTKMWKEQVRLGLIPYYMFIARDTGSKAFFEVPLAKAWNIFRKAYSSVSGIARTVRGPSMSCGPGKVHLLGVTEVNGEKVFVLRFLQCRDPHWLNFPFCQVQPLATWFDDLKPAFGETKFFFERENFPGKMEQDDYFLWE